MSVLTKILCGILNTEFNSYLKSRSLGCCFATAISMSCCSRQGLPLLLPPPRGEKKIYLRFNLMPPLMVITLLIKNDLVVPRVDDRESSVSNCM